MNENMCSAFCTVAVLCLIVIAASQYKKAYGFEYYTSSPNDPRYQSISTQSSVVSKFSGDGAYEAPVFWNAGNLPDIDAAEQAAAKDDTSFMSGDRRFSDSGLLAAAYGH